MLLKIYFLGRQRYGNFKINAHERNGRQSIQTFEEGNCIEIFRSFCQWYQSQYNFEQIESTFWNACIYLIEKQKCRIDEKFSEALLQLLVLFQSFRINHRLKRYTKILQGLYWRTAIPYYF